MKSLMETVAYRQKALVLSTHISKSRGLTLVELLVAMAVSLLVILAAAAALLAG